MDKKCINLIDTPGFGQSGGSKEDERVATCLVEMVKELKHLDNIFLCEKASTNRVSTKVKDLFNRLNKLYATDIADRILGCFTYGSLFSGKLPEPALSALSTVNIVLNASDIPRDNHIFLFENNRGMWVKDPDSVQANMYWLSNDQYGAIMQHVAEDDGMPISLDKTKEVNRKRHLLEKDLACKVKTKIDDITMQMTGIGKEILKTLRNSKEIDNNKSYETTIMEKVPKMVKTDKDVLICLNCPEGNVCCFNCQDSDCVPNNGWKLSDIEAYMKITRPNRVPFIPAYIEAPHKPGK